MWGWPVALASTSFSCLFSSVSLLMVASRCRIKSIVFWRTADFCSCGERRKGEMSEFPEITLSFWKTLSLMLSGNICS